MLPDIKTLAKKSLENKWGEGKVLEVTESFTFSTELIDTAGESLIKIIEIKEACSFCYNALERAEVKSEYHIEDKNDIEVCEFCLIPRYICYNKGTEGLIGMLSKLIARNVDLKEDILFIIDIIRDCLRQIKNFSKISLNTERFISTLEVQ